MTRILVTGASGFVGRALVTELANFAAFVRGGGAEVVSLAEGLTTVRVAETLRESADAGATLEIRG